MGRKKCPTGPRLLAEEIEHRGAHVREVAAYLGCTANAVRCWIAGQNLPGVQHALALARWSGGRVPVEAWE